ncbi:uncharacterized protein Pyn_25837 [Prunus yedoensis var. nudiflora]|uniref:Uncharacterized protein n=1 Tax=Prunus yedoensis var. nudiflora TaxID=2094558 RepID=A0A314YBC1_PRUYE|nr:uncharacterized protein Pyn_25837 [Prunus yedoensis var. nudiflora]
MAATKRSPPIGSGQYPDDNYDHAAYFRNLHFMRGWLKEVVPSETDSSFDVGHSLVHARRALTAKSGCVGFLFGFPRILSLVRSLHLNAMEIATASFAEGDDKYAAPSGNQKRAKTGVGHLIVSGLDFFGKHSFYIEDFVDKAEETNLESSPRSPMERSWAWQPMDVPTMKIFLWNFLQAKRLILVSLACQLGFWIKKIGCAGWCLATSIMMLTIRF